VLARPDISGRRYGRTTIQFDCPCDMYNTGGTIMNKHYYSIVTLLSMALMGMQTFAAPPIRDVNIVSIPIVKVVGITEETSTGSLSLAERHARCHAAIPGSHWCSTDEFDQGGLVKNFIFPEIPPASWIRPSIKGGYAVYNETGSALDHYTVITYGAYGGNGFVDLTCEAWSSDSARGMVLIHNDLVPTTKRCIENLSSVCCAPVIDD